MISSQITRSIVEIFFIKLLSCKMKSYVETTVDISATSDETCFFEHYLIKFSRTLSSSLPPLRKVCSFYRLLSCSMRVINSSSLGVLSLSFIFLSKSTIWLNFTVGVSTSKNLTIVAFSLLAVSNIYICRTSLSSNSLSAFSLWLS